MKRRGLLAAAGAWAAWALATSARAEAAWPARTLTLIVPFAPAGIADIVARTVAQAMEPGLGQSIVVDNRPGAGSVVASSAVAHAAPDGYTLLLLSNANAVSAGLFRKLPFDVLRDFAPITTLGFFDLGIFVASDSKFRSLHDVVAYAKDKPGKLTIASISVGSTQHLAAELFKTKAGIDALVVPYKGTPAVLAALRTGEVDVAFEILGPMLAQVRAKTVGVVAVTSARRFAALPDVPTVIESGVPGYDVASWNALAAPAGTPPAVIARLNRAAAEALAQPAVQQRLQELGVRSQPGSPVQLESLLASEVKRWGDVIRAAKIEPE
jgi:tripartite-type tricarboxylate transporter receptor subunit TctC